MNNSRRMKQPRPRGSDSREELLRGKNRELQKQLNQAHKRIRELEKQNLNESDREPKTIEKPLQTVTNVCPECGKGTLIEQIAPHPTKQIVWATCDVCKHRERRK